MSELEADWQCILSTGEVLLLGLAKSMLDAERITYVVEGETFQDLIQPGRIGIEFNQIAGPMELWVPGERAENVKALLKDHRMEA